MIRDAETPARAQNRAPAYPGDRVVRASDQSDFTTRASALLAGEFGTAGCLFL